MTIKKNKLIITIIATASALLSGVLIFLAIFFGLGQETKEKESRLPQIQEEIKTLKQKNEELVNKFNEIKNLVKVKTFNEDFFSDTEKTSFKAEKQRIFDLVTKFKVKNYVSSKCQNNQNLTFTKICLQKYNQGINNTINQYYVFETEYNLKFKKFNQSLIQLEQYSFSFVNSLSSKINNTINSLTKINETLGFAKEKSVFFNNINDVISQKNDNCKKKILYQQAKCFENLKTELNKTNASFVKLDDAFNFDHKQFDLTLQELNQNNDFKENGKFKFLIDLYTTLKTKEVEAAKIIRNVISYLPFLEPSTEINNLIDQYINRHEQQNSVSVTELYRLNTNFNNQISNFFNKKQSSELIAAVLFNKLLVQQFEENVLSKDNSLDLLLEIKNLHKRNLQLNIEKLLAKLSGYYQYHKEVLLPYRKKNFDYSQEQQIKIKNYKTEIYSTYLTLNNDIKNSMEITPNEFERTFNFKNEPLLIFTCYGTTSSNTSSCSLDKKVEDKFEKSISFLENKIKLSTVYLKLFPRVSDLNAIISNIGINTNIKKEDVLTHIKYDGMSRAYAVKIDNDFFSNRAMLYQSFEKFFYSSDIYYNYYNEKFRSISNFISETESEIYLKDKKYYNFFFSLKCFDSKIKKDYLQKNRGKPFYLADILTKKYQNFYKVTRTRFGNFVSGSSQMFKIAEYLSEKYNTFFDNAIHKEVDKIKKGLENKEFQKIALNIEKFVLDKLELGEINYLFYLDWFKIVSDVFTFLVSVFIQNEDLSCTGRLLIFLPGCYTFWSIIWTLLSKITSKIISRRIFNFANYHEINGHKYKFIDLEEGDKNQTVEEINQKNFEEFKAQEEKITASNFYDVIFKIIDTGINNLSKNDFVIKPLLYLEKASYYLSLTISTLMVCTFFYIKQKK